MLVLTRRETERVLITTPEGKVIAVEVLDIQPGRVRLGFAAETGVAIVREEIAGMERRQEPGG